jgi:hypothetical protein
MAPSRNLAQVFGSHGIPTYSYRFDHLPFHADPRGGIGHFVDVAFVFGTKDRYVGNLRTSLGDSRGDQLLSDIIQRMVRLFRYLINKDELRDLI